MSTIKVNYLESLDGAPIRFPDGVNTSSLGLGTAANADTADFATAAQGGVADTAMQPGDVSGTPASGDATVPISSHWAFTHANDLNAHGISAYAKTLLDDANDAAARATLGLGSAAVADASSFATGAQGSKADTAVQPEDIGTAAAAATTDFDASGSAAAAQAYAVQRGNHTGTQSRTTITGLGTVVTHDHDEYTLAGTARPIGYNRFFLKSNPEEACFYQPSEFGTTVKTSQAFMVEVNGVVKTIAAETTVFHVGIINMGYNFYAWVTPAGLVKSNDSKTTPPEANSRLIGGWFYTKGSTAAARSGGNSSACISKYSFWDLKYRAACGDNRGMVLVNKMFWCDSWLLNKDPHIWGTSQYGVTIADGSNPPTVPAELGGNGVTRYGMFCSWDAQDVLAAHNKRMATVQEFQMLAFGVTELTARGTDPVTCNIDAPRTSKWGVMQATGNMWTWGANWGGPYNADGFIDNTYSQGQTFNLTGSVTLGGAYDSGATVCGRRSSNWSVQPHVSFYSIGTRGVCDHVIEG